VGGFMYATSKYAVVGLSESIRDDLSRRGVGVSVLCPGPVSTNIFVHTEATRPDQRELNASQQRSMERMEQWLRDKGTEPDEVGRMVVEGIRTNALYIHTDRWIEDQLIERTNQIIAAMPSSPG
jgi:short-subunit dehydrogenase